MTYGGELTPSRIKRELDKYIIGQDDAKRALAVAVRNRYRRLRLPPEQREEILPRNLILIGSTGVGKTELVKRLSMLIEAPFVKVEATRFTEVGYVGRDVESMVRELVNAAVALERRRECERLEERVSAMVEDRLLALVCMALADEDECAAGAGGSEEAAEIEDGGDFDVDTLLDGFADALRSSSGPVPGAVCPGTERELEPMRRRLREGGFDDLEIEVPSREGGLQGLFPDDGGDDFELSEMRRQIGEMMRHMLPERTVVRRMTVAEAREVLAAEAYEEAMDKEKLVRRALRAAEERGIIFLDELDKIAVPATARRGDIDVSREGVQRDLLPIVEGTMVRTRYGPVRTDHILFIAAGAFHEVKPSDLIPELQGRFPVRVELDDLGREELRRILVEPKNALLRQYRHLLRADGVELRFTRGAVAAIADYAYEMNLRMENIGARRLHTVMERLLRDLLFDAPEKVSGRVDIGVREVRRALGGIVREEDYSRFIL